MWAHVIKTARKITRCSLSTAVFISDLVFLCLCQYISATQKCINASARTQFQIRCPRFEHACSCYACEPDSLQWRHNGRNSVSNHQPHDCLLNRLFRRWSKNTSKLRVTGLCAGNSPGTGEFQHKWPVTRKMFPFDDVIMWPGYGVCYYL